eukprot:scaffold118_cov106-Skeletonema_dohrnii-CCMP3373.AAC.2
MLLSAFRTSFILVKTLRIVPYRICLKTIKHVNVNSTTIVRFYCCGGWICKQCRDESDAKCREEDLMKCIVANVLFVSQQLQLGIWYSVEDSGSSFFATDKEKGLQFIKQAADQRDPEALLLTALKYRTGTHELERDKSKYFYYLIEASAADLRFPDLRRILGLVYDRQNNENMNITTLAASKGDAKACDMLGEYFSSADCGLTKSLILAKHYSEKSLEDESFDSILEVLYT